jgi:hypothetical protein
MSYTRKTRDVFTVESNYGTQYGYEETYASYDRADAKARLKEYRENEPQYSHRLTTKREKI